MKKSKSFLLISLAAFIGVSFYFRLLEPECLAEMTIVTPSKKVLIPPMQRTVRSGVTVHIYHADIYGGNIGSTVFTPVDDPYDNVFHFNLDEQPATSDKVWLTYNLTGIDDCSGIARSINGQLSSGGFVVKKSQTQTQQRERIIPSSLRRGHNMFRFSILQELQLGYRIEDVRLEVEKCTSISHSTNRAIVLGHPSVRQLGKYLYVKGFVTGEGAADAVLYVNGQKAELLQSEFEYLVSDMSEKLPEVILEAVFPDGATIQQSFSVQQFDEADWISTIPKKGLTVMASFEKSVGGSITGFGAALEVPCNALKGNATLSVTALRQIDLPPLPPDMVNVTEGYAGYRFLPDGLKFNYAAKIFLPIDTTLLPPGKSQNDVRTYYFDVYDRRWKMLRPDTLLANDQVLVSLTEHFTDFINGIIKVPESPQTQGYKQTDIKDIKFAEVNNGIVAIQPPTSNPMGSSNISFPIKIPAGRNGLQPSLAIQYNSEGSNGWLGLGWDLPMPSVTLETRWDIPKYHPDLQSETYTLEGGMLSPNAHRNDWTPRDGPTVQFYRRNEQQYEKILRHGNSPKTYYWEVIRKDGTRSYFGGTASGLDTDAILRDNNDNIAQWFLREVRDPNGNYIRYMYETVGHTGVPGSNEIGRQVYLKEIRYTGHGSTDGKYRVTFLRDRELNDPQRLDVQINCRMGFKQVTADLLRKIEVRLEGKLIRCYELLYEEGAFFKTRLSHIKENDQNNEEFYNNTFDYYNEVQDGAGHYVPYEPSRSWTVPNDGLEGGLLNPFPGFEDDITPLGGSTSFNYNVNGTISFGIGPTNDKLFTINGHYGYTKVKNDGKATLIDMTGDGLLDKVFCKDGMYYEKNLGGMAEAFASPRKILKIDEFSHSETTTHNYGFGADFVAHISWDKAKSKTTTHVYVGDFNGDKLMDIVRNNDVWFNHLNADGDPEFSTNSANTPNPILSGTAIDTDVLAFDPSEQTALIAENPLHDVVRMWKPPYKGFITIYAPVKLLENTSQDAVQYLQKDGVIFSIEHSQIGQLWHGVDTSKTYQELVPTGNGLNGNTIEVDTSDHIYFRVQSYFDGAFDQVLWDPQITYSSIALPTIPNETDAQGRPIHEYKASEDFVLGLGQKINMEYEGDLRFECILEKPRTSDSITVQVFKTDSTFVDTVFFLQQGFDWDDVSTMQLFTFDGAVNRRDQIHAYVKSATNVDWKEVDLKVKFHYLNATDADNNIVVSNSEPLIEFQPTAGYTMFNYLMKKGDVFIAPESGVLNVLPAITVPAWIQQDWDETAMGFELTLSIKGENQLYAVKTIPVYGDSIPVTLDPSIQAFIPADEPIWVEYHIARRGMADTIARDWLSVNVSFNGQPVGIAPGIFTMLSEREFIFGSLPRGWGQFAYFGNGALGQLPIQRDLLKLNDKLKDPPEQQEMQSVDHPDELTITYEPAKDTFIMMFPDAKRNRWLGFDESVWVTPDTMSSSRMGDDDVLLVFVPPVGSTNLQAPRLVSVSTTKTLSGGTGVGIGGFSLGYSGSESNTTSTTRINVMDVKGTGYPSIIGPDYIQLSTARGGWSSDKIQHGMGNHESRSESEGHSASAGYSGSVGKNTDTPGKGSPRLSIGSVSLSKSTAAAAQSAAVTASVSVGISGQYNTTHDTVAHTWLDINGDGLVDKLYEDGDVQLNLGYRFTAKEKWGYEVIRAGESIDYGAGLSAGGTVTLPQPYSIFSFSFSGGVSVSKSESKTKKALQDVNGDGLMDIVEVGNPMKVRFNTGNGFTQVFDWNGLNQLDENKSVGEAANASFTACVFIPLLVITLKFCMTPGGSIGHGMSTEKQQLMDIDGDGFPDVLRSSKDGELSVQSSTIGRTNLLKRVNRPMGSSFSLEYERIGNSYDMPNSKWVMTGLVVDDGLAGDGADLAKTRFIYKNPQYNRREREFYGFSEIVTEQLDTENNNAVYRTIIQNYNNSNYYEKGRLESETLTDAAGNKYTETIHNYELRDAITGQPFNTANEDGTAFNALIETEKRFFEGQANAGLTNRITFKYDPFANIIEYTDFGDGTAEDIVSATIHYHNLNNEYIKSIPKSIEVRDHAGRIRYRETDIDNRGNVTQIRQYLTPDTVALYDMVYAADGNLKKLTRPENAAGERLFYEYTYDSEVQTYVTKVKDGYGYESESDYDYAFGQVIESRDLNKQRIVYSLDAKGRIDTIIGPYELAANKPYTIVFDYQPNAATPFATTRHFDPANGGDITTISFMDGLQRAVQVKKTGVVFTGKNTADSEVMIVSGRIIFDAFNRPIESYFPVTEPIGATNNSLNTIFDPLPPTRKTYDVLDRELTVTLPDQALTTSTFSIDTDNSGYTCFKTVTTDPLSNSKETYADFRGRMRAIKDDGPNGDIWTDFRYNVLGELLQSTDQGSNDTRYTYDQLGRRLSVLHPDAGLTVLKYDLVGNVLSKETPNTRASNSAIRYTYDHERLVQVDYPRNFQNMVRYSYGKPNDKHNRAGRVWLQEDATGGQEFFFGALGETRKTIRTIVVNDTRMVTYVSENRYDTWGRIDTMIYPDGEVLKYRYNAAGKLSSVTGQLGPHQYPYVTRLGYDKFEQRVFLQHGNHTESVYTYEPERRRLATLSTTDATTRPFMTNAYAYDAVGNVLSITNSAAAVDAVPGGPASHSYAYDKLYRLQTASGTWTGQIGSTQTYSLAMTYDDVHNIVRKTQTHLRDGVSQSANSYDQQYTYSTTRPHIPTRIGNRTYTADANGNLNGWNEDITNKDRFTFWDEENRVKAIWESGYLSQYTYDANGERVLKSHGGLQMVFANAEPVGVINHRDNFTIYASPYLVTREKQLTKHVYIESQRIVSKIGAGDIYFAQFGPPGNYLTAGNIDYNAKMQMLATADSLGNPVPPTPLNPASSFANVPLKNPDGPQWHAYDTLPYNNDNVPAGFNALEGKEKLHEGNQYFFHPDHLGSTSYITDANGKVRQHVEYLPFGETFVDEHLNNDPLQPYLFNAKEYDAETSLYYYGARYYDPRLSIWISVDPMAEKYPGWSPYNYTMLNPVKYVDPDGRIAFIPILLGIYAVAEFALSAYDTYDAAKTIVDPNASTKDKVLSGAGLAIGMIAPGGGYGSGAKQTAKAIDKATDGAKILDKVNDGVKASDNGIDVAMDLKKADFVVTPRGEAIIIPDGASLGSPKKGTGMSYTGGSGGKGMNERVTGVRIMDPNSNQGRRVNYMNKSGQTVDPKTGDLISNKDPRGHIPLKE